MNYQTTHKTAILLLFFGLTFSVAYSQQIYVEQGENSSSLLYTNTNGEVLENLFEQSTNFLALGYRRPLLNERLYFYIGAQYNTYASLGSDSNTRNFMAWNLKYAGAETGLDLKLFRFKKAVFSIKTGGSASLLVRGYQILNTEVLDLKNQDDFQQPLIMFNGGAIVAFPLTRQLEFYVNYTSAKSLSLIPKSSDLPSQETLFITSDYLSFGLRLNLSSN